MNMSNLEVTSQQETKSTPQKQPKYIYRAKIIEDDDSVFYYLSQQQR